MKKLLFLLAFLVSCVTTRKEIPTSFAVSNDTVQIVGLLTPLTIKNVLEEIATKPKDQPLNVYVHSHGGDLTTLKPLLDVLKNRNVTCFATMAGGATFSLFQACNVRLIMDRSVLVRMDYAPFKAKVESEDVQDFIKDLEETESDATGKSNEEISKLINGQGVLSVPQDKAVALGFADAVVTLNCLTATEEATLTRSFGEDEAEGVKLTMTQCPLSRKLIEFQPKEFYDLPNGELIINQLLNLIGIPFFEASAPADEPTEI